MLLTQLKVWEEVEATKEATPFSHYYCLRCEEDAWPALLGVSIEWRVERKEGEKELRNRERERDEK